MLKLLKTNPTVAIPVVVRRLRLKDIEFRAARDNLNRHWREMAQANYYKSLDHRGLTFRTIDKRAISNRTFLNDIKDRAVNNGNESVSALQARIDKAKEEHGSFFEITMAKSNEFLRKYDLAKLPKPDRRLFTPDLSLMYENNSCIQKDAYRILSFALERAINPTDKERCHRLWTEFLGPWFNLKLNWMLEPAVAFQETTTATMRLPRVVSQDDNSHDEEDDTPDEDGDIRARIVTEEMQIDNNNDGDTPLNVDHHPLPAGATVSTIYGEGCIIACRKSDNMYVVRLSFGTASVRPSAVLCSVLDAEKSAYTTHRMDDDHTKLERPNDKLIIGTQSLYLFFRLHQILCCRIAIARRLAFEVKDDSSLQTLVEPMPGQYGAAAGKRRYEAFLSLVYALVDGGTGSASEGGKFEDRVRTLLGHWAFELATMDKVISHILKNIQNMANDDTMWSLVQLFRRHMDAGGFKPDALRQEAAYLSDGEPMYAFQYCPIQKDKGEKAVLHIQSLGVIVGSEEEDSLSDRVVEPSSKRQRR
jgi:paired amphipathic helix protein Sin3a